MVEPTKLKPRFLSLCSWRPTRGCGPELAGPSAMRSPGVSSYELPDVGVEGTILLLGGEKGLRILHRGCDLEAVANDAWIAQQARLLTAIVAGDALRVEAVEGGAIVLPFLKTVSQVGRPGRLR